MTKIEYLAELDSYLMSLPNEERENAVKFYDEYFDDAGSENEQSVIDYKNGKDRAIGFLVGQTMKASKGKANPQIVNKLIMEMLKKR